MPDGDFADVCAECDLDFRDDFRLRAQVEGVNGWVDGGLYGRRALATQDAERLAVRFPGHATRVVVVVNDEPTR